ADILPSDTAFVGEESVEAGNIPDTSKGDFFITDPIDGTKNFVEGKRGVDIYTVNIALVLNSEPVLGVVHEPVTGDDFANLDLKTAVISVAGGPDIELKPGITHDTNGQELRRYHASCMSYADIMRGLKGRNRHRLSYEWDTAAQDAILRTAGGRFYLQETGEPLTYNKASEKFFNPPVIGWLEPGGPGAKTG
ncbi:MAG: inositol monophosphatase family protein, partial [Pseudomonadota bacterium]